MTAFEKLSAPFPPERVSWRVGSVKKDGTTAMALAYLDARDVMQRLDEVCTPGGWQNRYTHADRKTICEIGIFCNDEWVWKADGAGDSDIEAEKGALSDAFKRAAVRWGIGRYLYDLESPWVQIDQWKKILPGEMKKLEAILRRQAPADGSASQTAIQRKSSAQATRDGDHTRYIDRVSAADAEGIAKMEADFDLDTAAMPQSWLPPMMDKIILRKEELNPVDGAVELDRQYAETVR